MKTEIAGVNIVMFLFGDGLERNYASEQYPVCVEIFIQLFAVCLRRNYLAAIRYHVTACSTTMTSEINLCMYVFSAWFVSIGKIARWPKKY